MKGEPPAPKRNNINNDQFTRRKKRGCLGHFIRFLIAMTVIFAFFVGVFLIGGNIATRRFLDMSIFDTLGVIRDLGRARDRRIVTHGHSDEDQLGFESALRRQLFLTDDAPLNLDELMGVVVRTIGGHESNEALSSEMPVWENYVVYAFQIASGEVLDDEFVSNPFIDYITHLFSYDGGRFINRAKLATYDKSVHQNFILNVRDRELASFLNAVLQAGLRDIDVIANITALDSVKELTGLDCLEGVVVLEQMRFLGSIENPQVSIIVSIETRDAARGALDNLIGIRFPTLTRLLLPERLFLTINSNLNDGYATLVVNEMNSSQTSRFHHMIDAIMALIGNNDFSTDEMIRDMTAGIVEPMANAINSYGYLNQIEHGLISIDILNTLISVTNVNYGRDEIQFLQSTHVILALRYILTSDFENSINEDVAWQNWYSRVVEGYAQFVRNPADTIGWNRRNFEQEFLDEISRTLPLNLTREKCDDEYCNDENCGALTFDEIIAMFGIGVDVQSEYLIDFFDATGLYRLASEEDIENLRIRISNQMFGFLIDYAIRHIFNLEDAGILSDMEPSLYQLRIFTDYETNRVYMEAALALNLFAAFAETGFQDIIASVLSSRIMIFFTLDITVGEDIEHSAPTMTFNDLTREEFVEFLDILTRFGLEISEDDLFGWIENPMREMFSEMLERMPNLRFGVSDTIAIELDDVFQLLIDNALMRENYYGEMEVVRYVFDDGENEVIHEINNVKLQLLLRALFEQPEIIETDYSEQGIKAMFQNVIDMQARRVDLLDEINMPYIDTFNEIASIVRTADGRLLIVAGFETKNLFVDQAIDYDLIFGMPYLFVTITFYLDSTFQSDTPPTGISQGIVDLISLHPDFNGFYFFDSSYQFNAMSPKQKAQLYAIIDFFNDGLSDALQIENRIGDLSSYLWLYEEYGDLMKVFLPDLFLSN